MEAESAPCPTSNPPATPSCSLRRRPQIQAARTRAALAVNTELIDLYWRLGQLILERQRDLGWGGKVIDRLSTDLRSEFPSMRGLGRRNLHYMRAFAGAWPDPEIVQRLVAQLPWGHNVELLTGLSEPSDRRWYAEQALTRGWSRDVLSFQIRSRLHLRAGAASSNFADTLPPAESDLVRQLIKDPYHLDFLEVADEASERDVERALISHVERFLLELGQGFAFVGRQYPLSVGGEDFFVDLLFFHIPTKRYVVLELKRRRFTPEAVGKLNFYVNVVDDVLRSENENPTIGLLLCRTRNEIVVRYALSGVATPMAIAGYRLAELPPDAREALSGEDDLLGVVDAAIDDNVGRGVARRGWVDPPARQVLVAASGARRSRRAHGKEAVRLEDVPRWQARRGSASWHALSPRSRTAAGRPGRAQSLSCARSGSSLRHRVSRPPCRASTGDCSTGGSFPAGERRPCVACGRPTSMRGTRSCAALAAHRAGSSRRTR